MAVYEYAAVAKTGKNVKGVIDADSAAAARRKLRDQDLYPTDVKETKTGATGEEGGSRLFEQSISARDIALMTRQLAVLLQAGMALVEGLTALMKQTSNTRLRKIIFDVRDRVNEGKTLADALNMHPKVFKGLYTNMVRAGEASGALEQVLFRLADIQERQVRLQKRVASALAYPVFLALFGVAVIIFLMVAIMPRIMGLFERQNADLPMVTEVMVAMSHFISGYWWAILLLIACILIGWRAWVGTPKGRHSWDMFKLKAPLFGNLTTKIICARFTRTLGTMLQSGLTMMVGLDVVRSVVQNVVVEESIDDVKAAIRRGKDLAQPLGESGIFPPLMVQMTELGQRSGEIEDMLIRVADTYEEDVELTVDALVSLLEPIIIVVMAVFVGCLVASILLPILQLTQEIQ